MVWFDGVMTYNLRKSRISSATMSYSTYISAKYLPTTMTSQLDKTRDSYLLTEVDLKHLKMMITVVSQGGDPKR